MERRPLRSRDTALARAAARWLQARGATPNGISLASVGLAGLAGLCFAVAFRAVPGATPLLLIAAAALVQGRLACNLLDGMVAVEGGLKTPTGDLYNDAPDRVADVLILLGVGYGLSFHPWGVSLGWAAALMAVLTAYVRVLGGACGLPQQFTGPMAKPHRMALLTVTALLAAALPPAWGQSVLLLALVVVVSGGAWTCVRRLADIARGLNAR
ncbi:CDP-alcohol phosphatidyltransferase family protein [Plasticicumulans acidivorans]|uniref:Phosphatidylglycerophosphate synthase n=1 Tax=Plasticicumulans acidivorans TaxID=886464 RepID=A0A317MYU0_9GAMM|nr:CDP-alcohol phosphatidyltransferase family protein [Plasticicumulans acidivorans]PWV63452.1 phosphatidylglycerophosphate synthase [Plasticicumulans acidivorans]